LKEYIKEDVVNSIKNDWIHLMGYKRSIELYNNDDWCNQFLSSLYQKFEVVIIRDVEGLDDGFYVVDRNYTKFTQSPFIQNLISQIVRKEINKKRVSMVDGFIIRGKTHSKSIDKFFINYIKNNTILYYTYNEYVEEFNPFQSQQSNKKDYKPHTKSHHTVNGFYRKQPYGSRSNPKYKMIWIESYQRGGKKVG